MRSDFEPRIPPETLFAGQYRIEQVLAEGSVSEIYKAQPVTGGDPVAIKVLCESKADEPEERERQIAYFLREAAVTSQLSHPNIIDLVELGIDPHRGHYIVLEYLTGRTLEQAVKEDGVFNEARARAVAIQVLSALAVAHHQRVLHRDLKPSNIQLVEVPGEPEQVKVFDFGIALVFEELPWVKRLTQADTLVGTPAWMSPEQCRGHSLNEQCDLYAVGALLYYMTTGRPPFESESLYQVLSAVLTEDPIPLRDVRRQLKLPTPSKDFEKAVTRALHKDPSQRYLDATHFQGYLDRDRLDQDWLDTSIVRGTLREDRSAMGLLAVQLSREDRTGPADGLLKEEITAVAPQDGSTTAFFHDSDRATILVHPLTTAGVTLLETVSIALNLYQALSRRPESTTAFLLVAMGDPTLGLFDDWSMGAPMLDHLHQVLDRLGTSPSSATASSGSEPGGSTPAEHPRVGGVFAMPEWSPILRQEHVVCRFASVHDPVQIQSMRDRDGEEKQPSAQQLVLDILAGQSQDISLAGISEALSLVVDPLDLLDATSQLKAAGQILVDENGLARLSPSRAGVLPCIDLPPAEEALIHLLLFSHLERGKSKTPDSSTTSTENLEAVHRPSAIRYWMKLAEHATGRGRQQCLLRALRLAASSPRTSHLAVILTAIADQMSQAGLSRSAERWAQLAHRASLRRAGGD